MKASRQEVYVALDSERAYQEAQRGNAKRHEGFAEMSPGDLVLAMEEYIHKARAAWSKPDGVGPCLEEIRKVTALGVQAMERYGAPKRVAG